MNHRFEFLLGFRTACLAVSLASVTWLASAQTAGPTGAISGTVSSGATHNMLQGVVVAIPSLNRQAITDNNGQFLLNDLPAGSAEVVVSYTGSEEIRQVVVIAGGETEHLAFELKLADAVVLDKFIVSSAIEGDALAVQQERNAPNLMQTLALDSDIAAADIPNYDIGVAAMSMSGVAGNFSQGTVNEIFIRGMPNTLSRVEFDGLSGLSAFDGRRPTWTFFSGSLFQDLQLIKGQTPDTTAEAIGGMVNLITPSPLAMSDNRRYDYDAGLNWSYPHSDYRPSYVARKDFQPYLSLGYQGVYNILGGQRNLGILLRFFYGESQTDIGELTYNYEPKMPASPAYIWDYRYRDLVANRHVTGINLKTEYRASDTAKFFFNFLYNEDSSPAAYQQMIRAFSGETIATVDASGNPTGTGAVLPNFTNNFSAHQAVAGTNFTIADYHQGVRSKNPIVSAGGTHVLGPLTLDYTARYNNEKSDSGHGINGVGGTLSMTDNTIGWNITRDAGLNNPIITQTAGASIYNPNSYTSSVSFVMPYSVVENAITDAVGNATYRFNTSIPLTLKTGFAFRNQNFKSQLRDQRMWTPTAGATPAQFLPNAEMSTTTYDAAFPMIDPDAVVPLLTNPALWTENLYYRTMEKYQSYWVNEQVEGEYLQGEAKFNRLTVLGGLRGEETQDRGHAFVEIPPATAAQIPDPTQRALHDWDHPVENAGRYNDLFPAMFLTYDLTKDLMARASYSTSFGRPAFTTMTPTASINNTTDIITTGNPDLKPQYAKNIDLDLSYYFKPAGRLSVAYFHKSISDYISTNNVGIVGSGSDNGYQGNYAGYLINSNVNIGTASVSGWEMDYRQQLTFLPGFLKGFEVMGSYTALSAQGNYGGATTLNGNQVANFVPRSASATLSYHYGRFGIRGIFNYQGPYLEASGATVDQNIYQDRRSTLTMNVNFRVLPQLSVYTQVFNILQQTQDQYIDLPTRLYTRGYLVSLFQFGVKGQF